MYENLDGRSGYKGRDEDNHFEHNDGDGLSREVTTNQYAVQHTACMFWVTVFQLTINVLFLLLKQNTPALDTTLPYPGLGCALRIPRPYFSFYNCVG